MIKGIVLAIILVFGIKISIDGSSFSFGLTSNHWIISITNIRRLKSIHVVESSAGPLRNARILISKLLVRTEIHSCLYKYGCIDNLIQTGSLGKVLHREEPFCLATFPFLPFNENNVKQILSESQLTRVDTVFDNKAPEGIFIVLYSLKYQGIKR